MQAELQIKRVEDCLEWLESAADGYTAAQSISWLIDQVGMLCKSLAFVNNQMAVAKKILTIPWLQVAKRTGNITAHHWQRIISALRSSKNSTIMIYVSDAAERCSIQSRHYERV
jgi:hypothetical protein